MIHVFVEIQAKPGLASAASEIIAKSQAFCLSQAACSGFEIYQSCDDDHKFRFVETWDSIEEHKTLASAMMATDEFKESMTVFVSGPKIEYFQQPDMQ